MSRLNTIGFELNSVSLTSAGATPGEFDAVAIIAPTISSTTVHSGTYAMRCGSGTTSPEGAFWQFSSASSTGPFYIRFYFRAAAFSASSDAICVLHTATTVSATTPVASIRVTSGGALQLMDGSSQVGSNSSALNTGQWYQIELRLDGAAASGSRKIEARIDGTVFASNLTSTTAYSVDWLGLGHNLGLSSTGGSANYFYDDVAINSTDATGYPGSCSKIIYARPGGAGTQPTTSGDANPWLIDVDGDGGGGAIYLKLDETTPDGTTTYSKRDTSGGSHNRGSMYTILDPVSTYGLASGDTVQAVHICAVAGADSNTSSTNRNLIFRVYSKSGGTATVGSSIPFNSNISTSWQTNAISAPRLPVLTPATDPDTGIAWTVTGTNSLTNMQVGYQSEGLGTSSTTGFRISALWVVIETLNAPVTGTAALSGGGTLTAIGTRSTTGTASSAAVATLHIVGTRKVAGTAALADTATLAATQQGVTTVHGTLLLSGGGALALAGAPRRSGTALLAATAQLSAVGVRKTAATLLLSSVADLNLIQRVSVLMIDSGGAWSSSSVLRLGGDTWTGTAAMTVTGTLAATGQKITPPGGILQLRPVATLTATGRRTVIGVCVLAGSGTFEATAQVAATSSHLTLDRPSRLTLNRPSRLTVRTHG